MMTASVLKEFSPPPLRRREIIRYSGGDSEDEATSALIDSCVSELLPSLCYRVCYSEQEVRIDRDTVELCGTQVVSRDLARYLSGCERALVFGATVGLSPDRYIKKYSRISPSRALILSAIGSERVESLCDGFCEEMRLEYARSGYSLAPRFSAGYGDLTLDLQTSVFRELSLTKHLGVTLNSSMLMTPTKSVTAIVAIRPI